MSSGMSSSILPPPSVSSPTSLISILPTPTTPTSVNNAIIANCTTPNASTSNSNSSPALGNYKPLPRDTLLMQEVLRELNVPGYDPKLPNHMLDFVFKYVSTTIEESRVYSAYARKKTIDVDDIKLGVKVLYEKGHSSLPSREELIELARMKNSTSLPLLKSSSGIRLPPDRFSLTQPNYRLMPSRKTYTSAPIKIFTSSPTPSPLSPFKTPSGLPLRTVVPSNSYSVNYSTNTSVTTINLGPPTHTNSGNGDNGPESKRAKYSSTSLS